MKKIIVLFLFLLFIPGCIEPQEQVQTTTSVPTSVETTVAATSIAPATSVQTTLETTVSTTIPATIPESTSSTSTSTLTTTTKMPEFRISDNVVMEKTDDYRMLLSFLGEDGQIHKAVHLDSGPFDVGDEFVMNGKVYKFEDYETKTNNEMKIKLKDAINYDIETATLQPVASSGKIILNTYSFENSQKNDEETKLEPDPDSQATTVYSGTILGIPVIYADSLYLGVNGNTKKTVGVLSDVTGNYFNDIRIFGMGVKLKVVEERGTNMNGDTKGTVTDDDSDDVIIKLMTGDFEYVYIDFYDRNYNRDNRHYTESVKVSNVDVEAGGKIGTPDATLDSTDDHMLILPGSGYRINVTYGNDNQINKVVFWVDPSLLLPHQYGREIGNTE